MFFVLCMTFMLTSGACFRRFMFPKSNIPNHYLNGVFRPVDSEVHLDIHHNQSKFQMLDGVFCQIGSNPKHIGTKDAGYHWFDGDGMVHAVFFQKNNIHYTNHWVQTKRLRAEEKWGQKMYLYFGELRGFRGIMKILKWSIYQYFSLIPGSKGTANTAFMEWKNHIFALHEGDMPYEIDVNIGHADITTKDQWRWSNMRSVTAHPKIDEARNCVYMYGYNNYDFEKGVFFFNKLDENMKIVLQTNHSLINNGMIHDIAQTTNHLIIPDLPLKYKFNQIMDNKLPLIFDSNGTTRFGVIHKDYPEHIEWYSLDKNIFIFHFSKAQETENGFEFYACTMDFLDMMDFVHLKNTEFKIRGNLRLQKIVLDNCTKSAYIETNPYIENLDIPYEYNLDFPIEKDGYIYCSVFDAKSGKIVGMIRADTFCFAVRKPVVFLLDNCYMNSEPQIITLNGTDLVMSFTYNDDCDEAFISLLNMDAKTIDSIPIPTRIPPGFHSLYKH